MSDHACPIRGCTTLVSATYALCAAHARVLPTDIANAIARSYSASTPIDEQGRGFWRQLAAAQGWITKHYGAAPERARPSWAALVVATRRRDAERAARRGLPEPRSFDRAPKQGADTQPDPTPTQGELF